MSSSYGPNPDGVNTTKYGGSFDFSRIGIRVPTVMISAWIPKGYVGDHPGQKKVNKTSQYTHSSLIHAFRDNIHQIHQY